MLFVTPLLALATLCASHPLQRRNVAFFPPADGGGSMLDIVSPGLGEPLNVIVSGLSSAAALTDDGFINFARSIGFSTECLNQHIGAPQLANLGDGNGPLPETKEIRQDFGDAVAGTCLESLIGGNHFRFWRQNGTAANSGALFLAVSHEENLADGHTIEPDGYDIGRDELVTAATNGPTSFGGVTYSTTVETLSGLLQPGSDGINHGIAIDGFVKLLTITIQ